MTPALATVERSTKNAAADDDLEQAGLSINKSTFPQHFVHSKGSCWKSYGERFTLKVFTAVI